MKNLGRNPDLLYEGVQPIIDTEPWYLRSSAIAHAEETAALFVSENFQAAFLQASDDEWLYVHYASFRTFTGGGVGGALGKWIVFRATPGVVIYETPYIPPVTAGGAAFSADVMRDLWIPPSFGLLVSCEGLTVANSSVRIGALVSSVRV
jgi:hypothetical protein